MKFVVYMNSSETEEIEQDVEAYFCKKEILAGIVVL